VTQTAPLITRNGDQIILKPGDDIIASNVPDLRDVLKTLVAEGARHIVIDLARVRIIDSSGIGLLVAVHNSLSRLDGKLSVINASVDLMELFRTFRLDKHFSVSGVSEAG
jgi:anti-anti-sigma factor